MGKEGMDILETIPHRPPFLFVDRVLSCDENAIVAEKDWRGDEEFYKGHYPANPITPGVLLCESVFQTAAILMVEKMRKTGGSSAASAPVLARIEGARFRRMVKPGQTTRIEVAHKEAQGGFHFMTGKVLVEGKPALTIEFAIALAEG
jgi:3-hydroxyacyl-[acyl-carrier-protein] dehydratase